MTTNRRAFIAPVAEPLNGAWHDLSDFAERWELEIAALAAIKNDSPNVTEELDCPDVEGFGSLFTGQHYISPSEAWAAHEWLTACEEAGIDADVALAYAENMGERFPDVDTIQEAYIGEYEDVEAYAREFLDDCGTLNGVDDTIARYFDYEAYARDMVLGGDVWTTDRNGGMVHIFRNV